MAKRQICEKCGQNRYVKKHSSQFYTGYLCINHRCDQILSDESQLAILKEQKSRELAKAREEKAREKKLALREERRRVTTQKKEDLRKALIDQKHLTQELYDKYLKNKKYEASILKELDKQTRPPEEIQAEKEKLWSARGYNHSKVLNCTNFSKHKCNPVDIDAWKRGLWDPKEIRVRSGYIIRACTWFNIEFYGRNDKAQVRACEDALANKFIENGDGYGFMESEVREDIETSDRS